MCADAYIQYVKTLLLEAGVLGNALKGVPDWEDESSSNIESLEKMTEDEQEDVTHEENINELVILGTYTTTVGDCVRSCYCLISCYYNKILDKACMISCYCP